MSSTSSQVKMLDDLISGLVHSINAILPIYNKKTTVSSLTNIANSLINISKLQQLDRVIEGLLHVYAELIKTHETRLNDPHHPLTSSLSSNSGSSVNLLSSSTTHMTSSGAGSPVGGNPGSIDNEEAEELFIRSKLIIFHLFNCLLSAAINYDKLDLRLESDFDDEFQMQNMMYSSSTLLDNELSNEQLLDKDEKLLDSRQRGSEVTNTSSTDLSSISSNDEEDLRTIFDESKLPKLDVVLAQTLIKYIIDTLFPGLDKEKDKSQLNPSKSPPVALKHVAARVLFKVSVLAFDSVFGRVEEFFKGMKSDEVNISVYNIIEYLNFDKNKLTRLFNAIHDALPKIKKNAALAIAQPLRKAIWNYIVNYPQQFISDCRAMTTLCTNASKVFYLFSEKTKKIPNVWPVQTMVLLLCPKILSDVIMSIKSGKADSTYTKEYKFLETLKTSLKAKNEKSDFAVVCFVDLYKASSYLSKADMYALRLFISDVQNVMLDRLDNPMKTPEGKPDVSLMVNFLVSAYRVNPRNAVPCVFPSFIKGSSFCKLCMAKALFILAQEQAPLPWHPTLAESYQHIAKNARFMFQDALQEERNAYQQKLNQLKDSQMNASGNSLKQKITGSSKPKESEPNYSTETLLNLLATFYLEPLLPLENTAGSDKLHLTDILYFFHGLTNCLGDKNSPQIQYHAHRLLQRLFNVRYIMQWVPGDFVTGFIELSSSVIIQLSSALVEDKDIQGEYIMPILDLVKKLTSNDNKFISQYKSRIMEEHLNSRKRIQSWESIESSLLVLLCSTDVDIWYSAASCFGALCDQIDILGSREPKSNTILANYSLYRQVARVVENGKKGESQQKSITRLLRRVEVQTKANIAAFIEVFNRWRKYTDLIFKGEMRARENREDTNLNMTKMKAMWKNYTTFLCSIGGVCLQTGDGILASRGNQNKNTMTEDLIKELLRLLTLDHKYISDNVTRIIGLELSPGVYGVLFKNLHSMVADFFGEENSVKVSPVATTFVDKAINIVKSILEQAEESSEDLALANFEALILSFIRYCSQLVNQESVGIKCRLCLLIVTVMSKKDYITFGNEIQFRFNALRQIIEWTSEFASNLQDGSQSKKTFDDSELDELCLKAIAALLKNLSLMKIKREKVTAVEKDEMNKREFFKLFHFLSKYLGKSANASKPLLREYTIVSLGNLLESNINYGLEQFMRMTYVEDQETRSAFLAVLTRIVKQGIQLDQTESSEPKEKYDKLMNLLSEDNMSLVFLMLRSVSMTEQDELCKAFVKLFAEKGQVLTLLKAAIDAEVMQTPSASTLFRANSTASKMMSALCVLVGNEYMYNVLSPLIAEVNLDPLKYEIDPSKLSKEDDLQKNIKHLTNVTQKFIDAIINSANSCPTMLRLVCGHLAKTVEKKFPTANDQDTANSEATDISQKPKYVAMGGMLILRFLNPAVASPKIYGLVDQQPSVQVSRNLILVSKLLQNVANGVKFKEEFMQTMNNFISTNLPRMKDFFDKIAEIYNEKVNQDTSILIDEEERVENLYTLHRFLFTNIDKMKQKITNDKEKDQLEKLAAIVVELGKPPEKEKQISTYAPSHGEFTNVLFENFMAQMRTKNPNLSSIEEKGFFYKSGVSKEQRPVLYFIARKFEGIDNDEENENALYYVLNTLQTIFTKPYEVVVDITGFKEENGLQLAHLTKFFKLLPDGAKKNIARIIFFCPNSYFKEFVKPVQSKLVTRKNVKKIQLITSIKEMYLFIDEKNCSLPPETTSFEGDVQQTISPAWVLVSPLILKDAVIKLGSKQLCVTTKDDKILGLTAKKVEYIDLIQISQVRIEKNQHDASWEQVVIEYGGVPPKTLILKTEMNKQLEMGIKASKARIISEMKMAASLNSVQTETGLLTQEDIPGTALNMCFLNLESKFPQTRREAYNLLAALAEQFDFPVKLLETENMCVPHNTGDLVVALSTQVAHAKPYLTSQFLTESLSGFNKVSLAYKLLCLKYMKPWIPNLSTEYARASEDGDTAVVGKIREWFPELVKSTMEFPDVYPAMLSELWGEISKNQSLVAISMECILSASLESGIGTSKSEILNDLVVTLASKECSDLVVKIILDAAMNSLQDDITEVEEPIENNPTWTRIIHCCRFLLMLSFQNRIDVVVNVPSIFYLITMMVGRGTLFLRSTIHALAHNAIHSLATALDFSTDQMKLIHSHLAHLNSDKFRVMFIGNTVDKTDPFVSVNFKGVSKTEPARPTMNDIQMLASFITEITRTCSLVNSTIQKSWETQYLELFKPTAFIPLIALPRVLVTFGVMVKSVEDIEANMPYILNYLMDGFTSYSSNKADQAVSGLLCLSQLCNKLSADNQILDKLLLIPLILLSYADSTIFPVSLGLMETIITSISSSQRFNECSSIEDYFNKYVRDSSGDKKIEAVIQRYEKAISISFKSHFSFAISAFMLKGLTSVHTRDRTLQFMNNLLSISSSKASSQKSNNNNNNMSELLGIVTALIPFNFEQAISVIGIDKHQFFTEETFNHPSSGLLFARYLLLLVQNVELDSEKIVIYNILKEAYQKIPEVFVGVQADIMPRVVQLYTAASVGTNTALAETILILVNTIMTSNLITIPPVPSEDILKDILFLGMTRIVSFKVLSEQASSECHSILVEFIKGSLPNAVNQAASIRKRSGPQNLNKLSNIAKQVVTSNSNQSTPRAVISSPTSFSSRLSGKASSLWNSTKQE